LDTENVVVDREHVHGRGWNQRWESNRDLSVVNAREVARASWLVFFWLEGEGVRVHTRVWVTAVVVVRLHLVEVLTLLGLETVLAVEDQLEVSHWANTLFIEVSSGGIRVEEWHTTRLADWHIAVGGGTRAGIAFEDDVNRRWGRGEVPQRGGNVARRWVVKAPDKFLDWVVVGQTLVGGGTRSDGVGASVLHLLDEVFVTLLREAATLLGVQVHVVRPHLEHGGAQVGGESGGQVKVDAHFVVLKGDQWQVQTWVAVEEEDQRQVHGVTGLGSGHLGPVSLLGFIQVKLGVQSPPALVVLVDALTTDGEFGRRDRTFSDPASIITIRGAGVRRRRLEFDVHVADQIPVTGNSDGHAARVGGGTVNSLFDVFHREVRVALVDSLEEGDLWVTGQVDVLGAVGDELHETTGHCESFCTISRENNFG
jgi:hypothetical protein